MKRKIIFSIISMFLLGNMARAQKLDCETVLQQASHFYNQNEIGKMFQVLNLNWNSCPDSVDFGKKVILIKLACMKLDINQIEQPKLISDPKRQIRKHLPSLILKLREEIIISKNPFGGGPWELTEQISFLYFLNFKPKGANHTLVLQSNKSQTLFVNFGISFSVSGGGMGGSGDGINPDLPNLAERELIKLKNSWSSKMMPVDIEASVVFNRANHIWLDQGIMLSAIYESGSFSFQEAFRYRLLNDTLNVSQYIVKETQSIQTVGLKIWIPVSPSDLHGFFGTFRYNHINRSKVEIFARENEKRGERIAEFSKPKRFLAKENFGFSLGASGMIPLSERVYLTLGFEGELSFRMLDKSAPYRNLQYLYQERVESLGFLKVKIGLMLTNRNLDL